MVKIVAIVEGHGEVEALPLLLRRIAEIAAPGIVPEIPKPIRVPRQRILKQGEVERAVELAARKGDADGRILVLLDADHDCPRSLAADVLDRANVARADRRIRVVVAKAEYEAWFLAAAESLAGLRGIREDVTAPEDCEAIRDAKGWLSGRMPTGRSYRETLDQPALTARFDLDAAREASPSFGKMWRDVRDLLQEDA